METGIIYISFAAGLLSFNNTIPDECKILGNYIRIYFQDTTTCEAIIDTISESGFENIVIVCDIEAERFCKYLLKRLTQISIKIIYTYKQNGDSLKGLLTHDDLDERHINEPITDNSYMAAMSNGYLAYKTGVYPPGVETTMAKHVGVDANCFDKFLPIYSDIIDLNSAVIINGITKHKEIIGFQENHKYGFISHVHNITNDKVIFDGGKFSFETREISYSEYLKEPSQYSSNEICFILSINNNEDLDAFDRDLQLFFHYGKIVNVNPYLVDECRWRANCQLSSLFRYQIEPDGSIRPCLSCSRVLANLDDSLYLKQVKASKESDVARIKRKCTNCASKQICAKCSFLPDFLSSDEYCCFIVNRPFIMDYFNKKSVLRYLNTFSEIAKNNIENITISHYYNPIAFPKEKCSSGIAVKNAKENAFVFCKNGVYYMFNYKSNQIVEVDKKLVFLYEAVAYADNKVSIEKEYCTCLGLPLSENIRKQISDGVELLIKAGMIEGTEL